MDTMPGYSRQLKGLLHLSKLFYKFLFIYSLPICILYIYFYDLTGPLEIFNVLTSDMQSTVHAVHTDDGKPVNQLKNLKLKIIRLLINTFSHLRNQHLENGIAYVFKQ